MTRHKLIIADSGKLTGITPETIDLVVTSPPYPMIEMWDEVFMNQNEKIGEILPEDPGRAFDQMHELLDKTWEKCYEMMKPGGLICINVGDATRTFNHHFHLFPNHARIINKMLSLGLTGLPGIIWRKTTNAPNKFMGSGMLPPGAYPTLEHEHILIFRKGNKREFTTPEERQNRKESAYFWEERNQWFSDLWDLKGTTQVLTESGIRKRSAAFPFEIPYRLINMFSVKDDRVFDPYAGTGTTTLAALASKRNSVGVEIDKGFSGVFSNNVINCKDHVNDRILARLKAHKEFIRQRKESKGPGAVKYSNRHLGLPVMTKQETGLKLDAVESIKEISSADFEIHYGEIPPGYTSGEITTS